MDFYTIQFGVSKFLFLIFFIYFFYLFKLNLNKTGRKDNYDVIEDCDFGFLNPEKSWKMSWFQKNDLGFEPVWVFQFWLFVYILDNTSFY